MRTDFCMILISGVLSIGRHTSVNSYSRIWCVRKIDIGQNVLTSWNVQIMDSNFHYLIDNNGKTKDCTREVAIGDNAWIGNQTTINKESVLPNYAIVGSGSFVNKDFSQYGESIIIGGMPAKFIKSGYRRLIDRKTQQSLDKYFSNNPQESEYSINNDIFFK